MLSKICSLTLVAMISLSPSVALSADKKPTLASRIVTARAMYYTPTTAGLKSLHCDLPYDWKEFLTRFSGEEVADDNVKLKYFQSVRLSITDDLKKSGRLEWSDTGTAPEGFEKNADSIRDGMKQMISGFFDSWNAYMNGTMVPVPDDSTEISESADGIKLHTATKQMTVDEFFDRDILLTSIHVVEPQMDITAYPTFIKTPQGLMISVIRSVVHQPASAPAMEVTMTVTYKTVDGFQIPSLLKFDEQNVGTFFFPLANCSVQKSGGTNQ